MANIFQSRAIPFWLMKFAVAGMLIGIGGRAEAQSILGNTSLNVRLSADANLIEDPNDPVLAMLAAWKTQYDLQIARNMPYMLITNTSELASAEATSMTMTIGEPGYHFDWVRTIDASPGVGVVVKQVDTVEGGLGADLFELEFTGLLPGEFALMQLDIDPDDTTAFHLPDFRTVLFQANGDGTDMNSAIVAAMVDTASDSKATLNGMFEDYPIYGPLFVGPAFHGYDQMDEVNVFPMDLSGSLGTITPVPEPSALMLLALGVFTLTGFRAGRRRRS